MESTCPPHQTPMSNQPSFFYYNPESKDQHGQHGCFTPHPNEFQHVSHPMMMVQPRQHPNHHHLHPRVLPEQHFALAQHNVSRPPMRKAMLGAGPALSPNQTPSPQPVQIKPGVLLHQNSPALLPLDTNCMGSDLHGFPSTPPLSTSGSTISSPPSSCGMLNTPVNGGYFRFEGIQGVKEGCEEDVELEILANGDWARSASPEMTPMYIRPFSAKPNASSGLCNPSHQSPAGSTEGGSTQGSQASCPSLSPSPSPVLTSLALHAPSPTTLPPQPASSDFCDPRQLTVESSVLCSPLPDFPPLPPLSAEDSAKCDELGVLTISVPANSQPTAIHDADHNAADTLGSLPSFDTISELDSEDEFVKGIVNFTPNDNAFYLGDKSRRISHYSADEDDLVSEQSLEDLEETDLFARSCLPLPDLDVVDHSSFNFGDMRTKKRVATYKRVKRASSTASDNDNLGSLLHAAQGHVHSRAGHDNNNGDSSASTPAAQQSGAPSHESSETNPQSTSSSDPQTPSAPIPVGRRGRKPSLTEDPSKTFVCTLCSRRFRRQEHLKRHYRSLHTEEKPFECVDCGKKFSRSDNLAQHTRTHAAGSSELGAPEARQETPFDEQDAGALGAVLYEAAQAAARRSTSSELSDSGLSSRATESPAPFAMRKRPIKKRKREQTE